MPDVSIMKSWILQNMVVGLENNGDILLGKWLKQSHFKVIAAGLESQHLR